jgi:hypothetical protein
MDSDEKHDFADRPPPIIDADMDMEEDSQILLTL